MKFANLLYELQEWQPVPALRTILVFPDKDFFDCPQELHLFVPDTRLFWQPEEGRIE
jgi:hypothetical protein